jgi:beta-glucanase (GH16 family)
MSMVHPGSPDSYGCDIHTNQSFGFGYYEASVKTSNYPDGWGGFWILNTGSNSCAGGLEYGFESDIIETNVPASEQHIFWDGYGSCDQHYTAASGLPHGDAFHVYGFWLQPTGLTWYVDGVQTGHYAYNFPGGVLINPEYMILSNTYISGSVDNGFYAHWVRFYHQ